ncbi:glutamate--tRNA ligase, partial [Candidatus Bathyarchaeota archaeon]|nr:glutamate--tRNA ligase [Candidatus Bathyarchaeota archaeon]
MKEKELKSLIRKLVLLNAVQYNGRAKTDSVVGKLLAERPDLKSNVKKIAPVVSQIVLELNKI